MEDFRGWRRRTANAGPPAELSAAQLTVCVVIAGQHCTSGSFLPSSTWKRHLDVFHVLFHTSIDIPCAIVGFLGTLLDVDVSGCQRDVDWRKLAPRSPVCRWAPNFAGTPPSETAV